MNAKQQLAYNLNKIICEYITNKNIRRFYKKITSLNTCISKNSQKDLFDNYKLDIKRVYDDIINGEEDETIINDCINNLRQILLGLLFFE
jgi:hypothetical protein